VSGAARLEELGRALDSRSGLPASRHADGGRDSGGGAGGRQLCDDRRGWYGDGVDVLIPSTLVAASSDAARSVCEKKNIHNVIVACWSPRVHAARQKRLLATSTAADTSGTDCAAGLLPLFATWWSLSCRNFDSNTRRKRSQTSAFGQGWSAIAAPIPMEVVRAPMNASRQRSHSTV
jgi:hypothetical protein